MGGVIAVGDGLLFCCLNEDIAIVICDDSPAELAGLAPIQEISSVLGR
jgi:hypothetical protein